MRLTKFLKIYQIISNILYPVFTGILVYVGFSLWINQDTGHAIIAFFGWFGFINMALRYVTSFIPEPKDKINSTENI